MKYVLYPGSFDRLSADPSVSNPFTAPDSIVALSPYDVCAAKDIVEMIKEAEVFTPDLKAAFVINRKVVNTALGRDVVEKAFVSTVETNDLNNQPSENLQ